MHTTTQFQIEKSHGQRSFIITMKMDADSLEKLAGQLGWFNPEFLDAIEEAECDLKEGRIHRITSSKDLDS